jgi:hypothetical protein
MDTTKTDIARAGRAQEILDNPEFQAACDDIEQGIVDRWKASSINDKEGQIYLKLMLKIHGDFIGTLKRRLDNGKMADIKVDRQNKIAGIFQR